MDTPAALERAPSRGRTRSMTITELCVHDDNTVSCRTRTMRYECPFSDDELAEIAAEAAAAAAALGPAPTRRRWWQKRPCLRRRSS